ncbi:hypothetical protein NHG22_07320 [Streptomyces sp. ATE26]|uniref:hypothetical protein n=1 Tax=Streptomyces sp. ATE26 TaxID=2954237 RepID=UPI00248226B6|nr:hypothetical protein [Streptomyces sp. ATE26]MDI1453625.1 hypothetical protein [Streptomyces sp. ATE26]
MNLYIAPLNGLIVAVGCIVGYLVYRRPVTGTNMQSSQPQGDLAGGTAAALATILILAFLFGLGDGQHAEADASDPRPTPSSLREARVGVADVTRPSMQPTGEPSAAP